MAARTVRQAAKVVLPQRAVLALENHGRRRNGFGASAIDLAYVDLIRQAPLDRLPDPAYLEHDLLPRLGLNAERVEEEYPEELWEHCGHGLLHWQFPNQFAPYLVTLQELGVRSYLEIGCRHGGTFVITTEYLKRFGLLERAVAVDLDVHPVLHEYAAQDDRVTVRALNSQRAPFRRFLAAQEPFDLVLVDGDHDEPAVRHDVASVIESARAIALHDIVSWSAPGVGRVWHQLRQAYADGPFDFLEFAEQYPSQQRRTGLPFLGIGLLVRRQAAAPQLSGSR